MTERKYEFTGETTTDIAEGATLHRIRAVRDFGDVKAGELGGWVESEKNLGHSGDCWVYDESAIFGRGRVRNNAKVMNNSSIHDNGLVFDSAIIDNSDVFGSAKVEYHARIEDRSRVYQHAYIVGSHVCRSVIGSSAFILHGVVKEAEIKVPCIIYHGHIESSRDLVTVGPIGSEDGILTAYRGENGIMVNRGCFGGTLEKFLGAVERTHGNNEYGRSYAALVEFIKVHFGEEVNQP
ncbi:hypothetical protein WDD9_005651 [Paenibacillus melissococcoides]|uniref:hypothetical protein n=1 Tax=Paenibacillus TaxID=44249 RepID=UPI001B253E0F|nr:MULTISPECIES: hypothetical protein [Paenibacillus]MEB9893775.1 hypothetical protein [Bacillus cereus]GIO79530.1 hypothetical protein J6TS7_31400 [Paenibacillus dendritiformis]CAH8718740.1 hypothetical protein HTL2_005377 [Paenibacillus melissococcoides]CAH8719745.1 hypothetical protein WDD9_005651 [Paenibacillus melissococcoides]